MLADITQHCRFTAEEFRVLAMDHPVDVPALHRQIKNMIEVAGAFISRIPSDYVGMVFLDNGKPVEPDLENIILYTHRAGARRGLWPSSSEISSAMLDRYNKQSP